MILELSKLTRDVRISLEFWSTIGCGIAHDVVIADRTLKVPEL